MSVNVITGQYVIIPKDEWRLRERKTIKLERRDWEIVKKAFYDSCISYDCTQSLNLISHFFETLDQAVGMLPK